MSDAPHSALPRRPARTADRSLYFLAYQAGKRSITLNLDSADGRELLEDLVRKSDFLVESFPVGYLESIGLGYDAARRAQSADHPYAP